jgi:hypothetical protein
MKIGDKYMGKIISEIVIFKNNGTFESYYAAEKWVKEKGYSRGSTCVFSPVAIIRGPYNLPQKWRNMTMNQRNSVDGVIEGEMREGPVRIVMFEN